MKKLFFVITVLLGSLTIASSLILAVLYLESISDFIKSFSAGIVRRKNWKR